MVPEGECCPRCVLGCSAVSCLRPVCRENEKLVVPEGECCPQCVPSTPDCSAVSCLKPDCEEDKVLVVPEGQCCPRCVPRFLYCSAVSCSRPVCEENEGLIVPKGECCPQCVNCSAVNCQQPVCHVGEELVVSEGECCPRCERIQCEIEGQVPSTCASLCPRRCNSPIRLCPTVCVFGCKCPSGQLIDSINRKCVPPEECPGGKCLICNYICRY